MANYGWILTSAVGSPCMDWYKSISENGISRVAYGHPHLNKIQNLFDPWLSRCFGAASRRLWLLPLTYTRGVMMSTRPRPSNVPVSFVELHN